MVRQSLHTYLNDHLSGATAAIEIIRHLAEQDEDRNLAGFAVDLKTKIDDDRLVLVRLLDRTGAGRGWIRLFLAWCAGIASQLKFGPGFAGKPGTFEALETLSIGIWGKRALWRILQQLKQNGDPVLDGIQLEPLIQKAESQFLEVETWRMEYGPRALGTR